MCWLVWLLWLMKVLAAVKQLQNGLGTVLGRSGFLAADSRDEDPAGENGAQREEARVSWPQWLCRAC